MKNQLITDFKKNNQLLNSQKKGKQLKSNLVIQKRAILYDIILPGVTRTQVEKRLKETKSLLKTYGGISVLQIIQRRHHSSIKSFIGREKTIEIINTCQEIDTNLIIVNHPLKNSQIYSIIALIEDKQLKIEVWDRIDLILAIFSKHATTYSAKLQLELAKIEHMGPRIYGMGEDLSNQGGGIGTRGIGETNTEIMKRHLREHKNRILKRIKSIQNTHKLNRKRRNNKGFKTVSIIGYTNAGKSALFQSLTRKKTYVQDELFATLDAKCSQLYFSNTKTKVVLTDTIGFIQDLPMELISAFKSTLEESIESDLLIHVIDVSDTEANEKIKIVNQIINELNIGNKPILYVYNKIDKTKNNAWPYLRNCDPIPVSAKENINIDNLKDRIESFF